MNKLRNLTIIQKPLKSKQIELANHVWKSKEITNKTFNIRPNGWSGVTLDNNE